MPRGNAAHLLERAPQERRRQRLDRLELHIVARVIWSIVARRSRSSAAMRRCSAIGGFTKSWLVAIGRPIRATKPTDAVLDMTTVSACRWAWLVSVREGALDTMAR